jgi:3-oxoacyl-[acyl-carrier protein] reductase
MKPIAVITGASQGIGAATAIKLAQDGAHPILIARNPQKLDEVMEIIQEEGGTCDAHVCDVAQPSDILRVLQLIDDEFSQPPSIIVNNAGFGGSFIPTNEMSEEEWDKIFNVNVKAAFLFCKHYLPAMKVARFGRIINISSVYGLSGGVFSAAYSASKHALIGYTKSIAAEWGSYNITANIISPGFVDTAMGAVENDYQKRVLQQIPAHRQAFPEEIANVASFLIGENSGYINGANIVADGGLTAGFRFV